MRRTMVTSLSAAALLAAWSSARAFDGVDAIKQRGTLNVGVKADYKPFGFRDPGGNIVGIDPDLAADFAKQLGVKLNLVPVLSANWIEFLQQGKVDILIATMSDTPARRKIVQAIDPPYYSDAVNVLLSKTSGVGSWEDLNGKVLCGTSGAYYNRDLPRTYGAKLIAFDGSEKPLFALQQGNCVGYLYDQTFIQGKLLDPEWKTNYAMPLKGIMETPWIMAVAQGNTTLQQAAEKATVGWMKAGTIVDEEKKWGITPTAYALRMHDKYAAGK